MSSHHVDVLIIGAGISGVGAACHLERELPGTSYAILERRDAIGGTWDLFRYPGVRSDSDMFSFGYDFRPWRDTRVLADGESIRGYLAATADEYDVRRNIHFGRGVVSASWSSADALWTVQVTSSDGAAGPDATGAGSEHGTETWTAGYLMICTGYYNYAGGYRPEFPGEERFGGTVVHPQFWPEDLDCTGKRVAIIGSGATAITLVPALAETAEHVTMIQRTPTYVVSLPGRDAISEALRKVVPDRVVFRLARIKAIGLQRFSYGLARSRPKLFRSMLLKGAAKQLGGAGSVEDFNPPYDPWDQRLCVVPDGDLFTAIRSGSAEVVTDRIATFTETGIELESGRVVEADVVVTATGLDLQLLGGAQLEVDGAPVPIQERLTYKGVLLEGVPNATIVFGYVNASWTLKADLAAEYTCRLLRHLRTNGLTTAVAHAPDGERTDASVMDALNSGYMRRGGGKLPRQGRNAPWRVSNDYLRDVPMLRRGAVDDGVLEFGRAPVRHTRPNPRPRATA